MTSRPRTRTSPTCSRACGGPTTRSRWASSTSGAPRLRPERRAGSLAGHLPSLGRTPPEREAARAGCRALRAEHPDDRLEEQGLPPGVAKNLARGKPLPPGIAKRYLPPDLLGRLPARPGYEWVAVGSDIALIAIATGVIVDILSAAF